MTAAVSAVPPVTSVTVRFGSDFAGEGFSLCITPGGEGSAPYQFMLDAANRVAEVWEQEQIKAQEKEERAELARLKAKYERT